MSLFRLALGGSRYRKRIQIDKRQRRVELVCKTDPGSQRWIGPAGYRRGLARYTSTSQWDTDADLRVI